MAGARHHSVFCAHVEQTRIPTASKHLGSPTSHQSQLIKACPIGWNAFPTTASSSTGGGSAPVKILPVSRKSAICQPRGGVDCGCPWESLNAGKPIISLFRFRSSTQGGQHTLNNAGILRPQSTRSDSNFPQLINAQTEFYCPWLCPVRSLFSQNPAHSLRTRPRPSPPSLPAPAAGHEVPPDWCLRQCVA